MGALAGRTALVTGAAVGIGRAIAARFVSAGANLVVIDVAPDTVEQLSELGPAASTVEVVVGDVAEEITFARAVARVEERFGRLDILVNNACHAWDRPALELGGEEWQRTLDVCLTGMFHAVKHSMPLLLRAERPSIINLSSVNAQTATPGMFAYAAAKGGVEALTRQLAVEYGPRGVRTNAIAPGLIATEALESAVLAEPGEVWAAKEACPLRRIGRPEEVAAVAVFLASDQSSFVNGQVLTVDGGTTVQWPMVLLRPGLRDRAGLPRLSRTGAEGERA